MNEPTTTFQRSTETVTSNERIVIANGVEICIETFGDAQNPAVLLIHGACASMLWWEEELCQKIAAADRFVIRYDNRDTGRSVSYPPGEPGYSMSDLTRDAIGILDVLGIERANIVGRSMSGAIALTAGVDYADRVASLTFVCTTSGDDNLPPMSDEFLAATEINPDLSDPTAIIDYIVGVMKAFSGPSPYFDPVAMRVIAERDVARTKNIASALTNHFEIDTDGPVTGGFDNIVAPALVVHGALDPVWPLAHGEALRDAIPGAELLVLEHTGHEVPPALWDVFVPALIRHTARA
jgi:pimeloyl-ACP methyl ester carboxylesterase